MSKGMGAIVSVTLAPKELNKRSAGTVMLPGCKQVKQGACWSLLSFAELFQHTVRCACKSVEGKKEKERKAKL